MPIDPQVALLGWKRAAHRVVRVVVLGFTPEQERVLRMRSTSKEDLDTFLGLKARGLIVAFLVPCAEHPGKFAIYAPLTERGKLALLVLDTLSKL